MAIGQSRGCGYRWPCGVGAGFAITPRDLQHRATSTDLQFSDGLTLHASYSWDTLGAGLKDPTPEGPRGIAEAADFLVRSGAVLVGIDSYNIDDTSDKLRPVHTALLGNSITIVEHMTGLERLPARSFRFFAVPVKVKSFGTFPVRAFALI